MRQSIQNLDKYERNQQSSINSYSVDGIKKLHNCLMQMKLPMKVKVLKAINVLESQEDGSFNEVGLKWLTEALQKLKLQVKNPVEVEIVTPSTEAELEKLSSHTHPSHVSHIISEQHKKDKVRLALKDAEIRFLSYKRINPSVKEEHSSIVKDTNTKSICRNDSSGFNSHWDNLNEIRKELNKLRKIKEKHYSDYERLLDSL